MTTLPSQMLVEARLQSHALADPKAEVRARLAPRLDASWAGRRVGGGRGQPRHRPLRRGRGGGGGDAPRRRCHSFRDAGDGQPRGRHRPGPDRRARQPWYHGGHRGRSHRVARRDRGAGADRPRVPRAHGEGRAGGRRGRPRQPREAPHRLCEPDLRERSPEDERHRPREDRGCLREPPGGVSPRPRDGDPRGGAHRDRKATGPAGSGPGRRRTPPPRARRGARGAGVRVAASLPSCARPETGCPCCPSRRSTSWSSTRSART